MGGGLTFVQMREVAPLDPILSFDLNAPSEVEHPKRLWFRFHFRCPCAAAQACALGRTAASSAAITTAAVRRTNHRLCALDACSRATLQAETRACESFSRPSIGN